MFRSLLLRDQASVIAEATRRLDRFSRGSVEAFSTAFFTRDPNAAREWMRALPEGSSLEFVRNGLRTAARSSPNETLKTLADDLAPEPD